MERRRQATNSGAGKGNDPLPGGLKVHDDLFMVGRRNSNSLLQCNTYLRTFRGGRAEPLHWCVDPGSRLDYDVVRENLLTHLGTLAALRLFSLNHQDPDVVGNLTALASESDQLVGLVSEDAWRLVQHLGARPQQLHFPGRHGGHSIKLPGGNRILAVPTPFCHFRGAMAFYDLETRTLFSGDLFGGLNEPERLQLFAEERDWPGIAIFHQIYMPGRECVAYAIRQIRALRPAVELICPQHGFALAGDFMRDVMERLESLPVGMDRLASELDEDFSAVYREVMNELFQLAVDQLGLDESLARLRSLSEEEPMRTCLQAGEGAMELIARGIHVLPRAVEVLSQGEAVSFRNRLRLGVLQGCQSRGAPLPDIAPGMEELGKKEWIG
jgi:serine/threonine-protein kinase